MRLFYPTDGSMFLSSFPDRNANGHGTIAMPHVSYPNQLSCPWPGCSFVIGGVDFRVEKIPGRNRELLLAWYADRLAGRCPGCGRFVLFTFDSKEPVADEAVHDYALLPDDWQQIAFIEG
jgi:hypothetical protein